MTIKFPTIPVKLKGNATVFFEQYTGTTVTSAVGNKEPQFETIEIAAVITETVQDVKETNQDGPNVYKRAVTGYLLTKSLPTGLKASDKAECEVEFATGKEKGLLFFAERMTPFREDIIKQVGIPIQGTFQTNFGGT